MPSKHTSEDIREQAKMGLEDAAYNAASSGISLEDATVILQAQYAIESEDPEAEEDEDTGDQEDT